MIGSPGTVAWPHLESGRPLHTPGRPPGERILPQWIWFRPCFVFWISIDPSDKVSYTDGYIARSKSSAILSTDFQNPELLESAQVSWLYVMGVDMPHRYPKEFNISGICNPLEHYMLPALNRIPNICDMIRGKYYFIIHAPRQSGKSTFIEILNDKINASESFYSFRCSLANVSELTDSELAMSQVFNAVNRSLSVSPVPALSSLAFKFDHLCNMKQDIKIHQLLFHLCSELDKETVIIFDEIDSLKGPPLISFLGQLREAYLDRRHFTPLRFPRSIALVGLRDIVDYNVKFNPGDESSETASPFNVVTKKFTLNNFTIDDIASLYGQHTEATGQVFRREAIERAWFWSEGQPWLVNALAREVITEQFQNDYSDDVTPTDIDQAAMTLISSKSSHFMSLKKRLEEVRIRRVVEATVFGIGKLRKTINDLIPEDDFQYAVDLGLLKRVQDEDQPFQPSNPIYGEIIFNVLTSALKYHIPSELSRPWTNGMDLDLSGFIKSFQLFWSKHSEMMSYTNAVFKNLDNGIADYISNIPVNGIQISVPKFTDYIKDSFNSIANESISQLVLFAFMQTLKFQGVEVIAREYPLGNRRLDICLYYKDIPYPVELKIKGVTALKQSLRQLHDYMDKCMATDGWLVIFDLDRNKTWENKIKNFDIKSLGKTIHVFTC
ncbi:MAG: AAA-like domain-containing protein [Deltaproteobacteria bacterium]|jgi:hypothetical protein|nr:AAA-like domain-containing protein [Deltaproteobacteria bacterium]